MAIALTEKDELLQSQLDLELNSTPSRPTSSSRKFISYLSLLLSGSLFSFYLLNDLSLGENLNPVILLANLFAPITTPTVEIFEITPDYSIPASAYSVNSTLVNQTLSDGLSVKYHAPKEFNFTGGLLTLNFTNNELSDTFEPIVAEISIGGSPIWRTSTPGSKLNTITKSSTVKNVTEFLSLFEEKGEISINYLEGADAAIDVALELSLYNDTLTTTATTTPVAAAPSAQELFSASGPADLVYPLTNDGKPFELPGEKFSIDLPTINSNISYAKVSLFASATKDEVLYYKNDISKFAEPGATGPLRYLNVFIDGVYISSISPKPTLFHSNQITTNASSLWEPLADSGSFEGLSYEIDLISVLPLLWESGAKLDVVVVSPVTTATKGPGAPPALPHPVLPTDGVITTGSWLLSGNLLGWESEAVAEAVGDVLVGESSQLESGLVVEPPATTPWQPAMKNQIIKASIDAGVISQLNFTFVDASTVNYTIEFNSSTHAFLMKQSKQIKKAAGPPGSGLGSTTKSDKVTLINGIKDNFAVLDTTSGLPVMTKNQTLDFPFIYDETTTDSTTAIKGPTSSRSVKATISSDIKTKVDKVKTESYKAKEKLTLDDIIGAQTDIKVETENINELPFSREVAATNGVVTKDTTVAAVTEFESQDVEEVFDVLGVSI